MVVGDNVKIFIQKEIYNNYLKDNKMTIGLEGHGRFILDLNSEDASQKVIEFCLKEEGDKMGLDRKAFELIAIGASIAANCKT